MGTLVNSGAIILGSLLGLIIGLRFTKQLQETSIKAMSLVVMVLGVQMSLKMENVLLVAGSMALGGLVGEIIDIEKQLEKLADILKSKIGRGNPKFNDGFVAATLLYCVGSMAILGSIQEGIKGDPSILYTKALLDGVVALPMAAALGFGVLFSFVPVAIYQGSITLFSMQYGDLASEAAITSLTAVGGLLLIGIAINMLELGKIRVGNLLPALVFALGFSVFV